MYAIFIFPSVLIRLIVSVYKLYGSTTTENCVFPAVCIFPYKPYNPLQTADYLYSLFRQDIHMGSGTTAVVARRLGRKYIGFELNPDYIDICRKRLKQGNLFS